MANTTLTVNVDVQMFHDGEVLNAARLNELVAAVNANAYREPHPSLVGAVCGVAAAAAGRNPRLSRRALLGLR